MKNIFTLAILTLIATSTFALTHHKHINALKATVHEVNGMFVLIPEQFSDHKLIPLGLPAEYQIEGLAVTVDGTISRCKNKTIDIAINAIAVEQDVQKQLGLQHIEYNIKAYALSAAKF
ncbi:MAG: hypothetical protein JNL95_05925 [Chitinophagales bacterium]|nr:hypothetical protein [Chitinophagales bacterium]